jgi:hypothetical protein
MHIITRAKARWLAAALVLAGCSAHITPGSLQGGGESVDQVLLRIKQEVGTYQTAAQLWRTDPEQDPARPDIAGVVCGDGRSVDFDITKVKLELVAVIDDTDKAGVSLKIPFGASGLSVGPGFLATQEAKATQTLELAIYPNNEKPYIAPEVVLDDAVPVARALIALRDSLIKAAHNKPCMSLDAKGTDGSDNTFKIAFNVKKERDPQLGFGIYVIALTAGTDQKSENENTVTVSFKPRLAAPGRSRWRALEQRLAPSGAQTASAVTGPVGLRGTRGLVFFRVPTDFAQ